MFSIVEILNIDCHEEGIMEIAGKLSLTFYDASYIFYAKEKRLPLTTEDGELKNKAKNYVKTLNLHNINPLKAK